MGQIPFFFVLVPLVCRWTPPVRGGRCREVSGRINFAKPEQDHFILRPAPPVFEGLCKAALEFSFSFAWGETAGPLDDRTRSAGAGSG